MSGLPESVRVGYRTYRIISWAAVTAAREQRFGEHDDLLGEIRVRDDIDPVETVNTLLHEILHACWRVGCVEGGDEEKVVSVFANQLTQVWRDNPELVRWIDARLRATG